MKAASFRNTGLWVAALSLAVCPAGLAAPAEGAATPLPAPLTQAETTYDLSSFGSLATPAAASATLVKAVRAVQAAGGGIIVIPLTAPAGWVPTNTEQEMTRTPAAPAPAKNWGTGPAVTVIDARSSRLTLPQVSGLQVNRDFNVAQGQSSPHWTYHPMLNMRNNMVGGTSDYAGTLTDPVAAGADRLFYLEPMRGVFPGQVLESKTDPAVNVTVKKLGYDAATHRAYFVADGPALTPGTVLQARTVVTGIKATTRVNTEQQTFDVYNIRNHYSQGDTYMFSARQYYMGDNYSPRDEITRENMHPSGYGGALLNARTQGDVNVFRGQVAAFDTTTGELRFTAGTNAHTLASGRPLLNLNPTKTVTAGSACINYPGGALLNWGGSLWSKDAPWTAEVVGRYFALDQQNEMAPSGNKVRRWYLITQFRLDPDGTKRLSVQRHWWGAKNEGVGISNLYSYKNYTMDEKKPVPLKYIIAPGNNVYDVSRGAGTSEEESAGAPGQTVLLSPTVPRAKNLDFAPGDPIEQAIGSEPFMPTVFRAWQFDEVPGAFPSPVMDLANRGTPRDAVISVNGPGVFNTVLGVQCNVADALLISGDVDNAFMRIYQKEPIATARDLPVIQWDLYKDETKKSKAGMLSLSFLPMHGGLAIRTSMDMRGSSAVGLPGLSTGISNRANNLRGIDVPVTAGLTEVDINLPNPEKDATYALKLQPGWLTESAVTKRTAQGFHVKFSQPAPANATLSWLLVR